MASSVLEDLSIKPETIRRRIEETVRRGKAPHQSGTDLPYTSRAKKVLELAMYEARELGHSYVGTEHLLLGLIREEKGIGAQVLAHVGVTLARARVSVQGMLGASTRREGAERPGPDDLHGFVHLPAATGSRRLLAASAVLAWAIGGMLVLVPRNFEAPMGIVVDDRSATIAQAQGAILIGLGFINWLSRGVTDRAALGAVLYGNLVVQALSFAIVLRAVVRGLIPIIGIAAALTHLALCGAFYWQLRRLRAPTGG